MHIFGCDICQDVCPWNARHNHGEVELPFALDLEECSNLSEQEFHLKFQGSALARPKYAGFLRNVAVAMGNSRLKRFEQALERLASDENSMIAEHARWALEKLAR
jgi:epoxyqueuosine reductase